MTHYNELEHLFNTFFVCIIISIFDIIYNYLYDPDPLFNTISSIGLILYACHPIYLKRVKPNP